MPHLGTYQHSTEAQESTDKILLGMYNCYRETLAFGIDKQEIIQLMYMIDDCQ